MYNWNNATETAYQVLCECKALHQSRQAKYGQPKLTPEEYETHSTKYLGIETSAGNKNIEIIVIIKRRKHISGLAPNHVLIIIIKIFKCCLHLFGIRINLHISWANTPSCLIIFYYASSYQLHTIYNI